MAKRIETSIEDPGVSSDQHMVTARAPGGASAVAFNRDRAKAVADARRGAAALSKRPRAVCPICGGRAAVARSPVTVTVEPSDYGVQGFLDWVGDTAVEAPAWRAACKVCPWEGCFVSSQWRAPAGSE
jgi:hypothetical protein